MGSLFNLLSIKIRDTNIYYFLLILLIRYLGNQINYYRRAFPFTLTLSVIKNSIIRKAKVKTKIGNVNLFLVKSESPEMVMVTD